MARNFSLAALLLLTSLYVPFAFTQQDDPAPQTDSEPTTEPVQPDQEVEVNEDNYRQFMELKDGLQQRTIAPQDSFESRSGLQKMDQLPEASQKHLRNQLREIISQGERWQPGDESADYPYVPSEAARANAKLQNQEAEAWGELLDNYHAREAQIHANSARTRAALAGSTGPMGTGDGESGGQKENRSGEGQQGSEQSASQPGNEADSFAPGAQSGADAQNADGSEQNAMQYLQQLGQQGGPADSNAQQAGDSGQMTGQTQQGAQQAAAQTSGQMTGQTQQGDQQAVAQDSAQSPSANPGAQAASQAQTPQGSEQNAMQYLQQLGQQQEGTDESGDQQAGAGSETISESTQESMAATDSQSLTTGTGNTRSDADDPEGVSQNALEYLSGEGASEGETPADTLSLEDLLNAQGVAIGADASQPEPEEPPKDPPD